MEEKIKDEKVRTSPVLIFCGMAGSGKTKLVQRIKSYLGQVNKDGFVVNLDPAVSKICYEPNLDIRKYVDYKNVMKKYGLGPNGAIVTALNIFVTQYHEVLQLLENFSLKDEENNDKEKYVVMDTPGQIEVFNWSASGTIIMDSTAATFPTILVYVVDTARTIEHPSTFMANMMYACSIMYKSKLPMIVCFTKTDLASEKDLLEWMQNDELLRDKFSGDSYDDNFQYSMSLFLQEFYSTLKTCGVSALTGRGMEEFFQCVEEAVQEYQSGYHANLIEKKLIKKKSEEKNMIDQLNELKKTFDSNK